MEEREIFKNLTIFAPFIVRLDGRAFHRLTRDLGMKKPYDGGFCRAMAQVCGALIEESGLEPAFAYTFSDEISLCFLQAPFGGRVEKIDSVCAGFAASALTLALGVASPLSFDARIIPVDETAACAYFDLRQREAWRNHINAYCQQALIEEGMTAPQAAKNLKGMKASAMHDFMHARGVNLAKTPSWQRRGVIVRRVPVMKKGFNPISGEHVEAERRVVRTETYLPLFSAPEGVAYIRSLFSL